ncbi:MAG: hypothetical protein A3F70_08505 [Acidobacteria bacterium RIFCSPLOWO2_12_FULL_67_14]|nr:MAG: hypothetical protein A3H29_01670 [Acidobacteria bacterium RIFCSPLOWO2_02_FULL_67_21]OFW40763.1 MAG: hypothetical protein A3F70_08505 [Acidobacteria bacterium RIFCSPLOWO2_12_FULL_67_14]
MHEQVAAQLVFLIGTGVLKPGAALPSVRALAQRLGIHRNTISKAYHDLTLSKVAEKRAGRRLAVRSAGRGSTPMAARGLDDIVNAAIAGARQGGYSLQQLHERLRDHLRAAPPDHLLVLSEDAGMRVLLPEELKQRFSCPVDACTPAELLSNPARIIGALVVSPQGHLPGIQTVLPAERPAIAITYSPANSHLQAIRRLPRPSLIAVVSVSRFFLDTARGVLAPAVGRRHSMRGYLMAGTRPETPGAADLLLCGAMTFPVVRARYKAAAVTCYKLISPACLDQIAAVLVCRRATVPSRATTGARDTARRLLRQTGK